MRRSGFSKRLLGDRRGASTLEFAIVAVLFFGVLVATIDIARFWFANQAVRWFTAEYVRAVQVCDTAGALVRPDLVARTGPCNPATLRDQVLLRVTGLRGADLTATFVVLPQLPGFAGPRSRVTVDVSYDFDFVVNFFGGPLVISDRTVVDF